MKNTPFIIIIRHLLLSFLFILIGFFIYPSFALVLYLVLFFSPFFRFSFVFFLYYVSTMKICVSLYYFAFFCLLAFLLIYLPCMYMCCIIVISRINTTSCDRPTDDIIMIYDNIRLYLRRINVRLISFWVECIYKMLSKIKKKLKNEKNKTYITYLTN